MKRSKISEAEFRKMIQHFTLEGDTQKTAALTSLSRNTINRYVGRTCSRIVDVNGRCHYRPGSLPSPQDAGSSAMEPIGAFLGFARNPLTRLCLCGVNHYPVVGRSDDA